MSGGSWNYAYRHVEDMAAGLRTDTNPLRRAFVTHLDAVAKAMHDIEWVDSSDYGRGEEFAAIHAAIGPPSPQIVDMVIQWLRDTIEELEAVSATEVTP